MNPFSRRYMKHFMTIVNRGPKLRYDLVQSTINPTRLFGHVRLSTNVMTCRQVEEECGRTSGKRIVGETRVQK